MPDDRSHWAAHSARWSLLGSPLRPPPEAVDAVTAALVGHRGPTLLLGVTPELAAVADELTAVERSRTMIEAVWSGDRGQRRAVLGDWLELTAVGGRYVAAVGDGSLNVLPAGDHRTVFGQLGAVLEPGARIALRTFVGPDEPDSLDDLRDAALAGRAGGFNAFKLRVAMAVAARQERGVDVAVTEILAAFEAHFPDRDAVVTVTGWDRAVVDTIDGYRESSEVYSFPTAQRLLDAVPPPFVGARFLPSGNYELAERCPVLVADVPG